MSAIAKKVSAFFFSLRTAIWLLITLLLLLLFGSILMPLKEEFQSMTMLPLFQWMTANPVRITWWLWAAVLVLSLLTANTLLCSIESVLKKRGARNWLLVISPQVIHIGFLFILLAHLLSSYGSFKGMAYAGEGTVLRLPNGLNVLFREIKADVDPAGFVEDWSAKISYYRGNREVATSVIRPNEPSFEEGLGIYVKTVRMEPFRAALIEVSREPGAPWALAGGILFIAGMATLLILKIRMEEAGN
jgi:cytochrome c biogenesis protein ResB